MIINTNCISINNWRLNFPTKEKLYFQLVSPIRKNKEGTCWNFGFMKKNIHLPWNYKGNFYIYDKFNYDINSPSC